MIETPEAAGQFTLFEYIREASKRYFGNHAGRIILDYSSMVSAYFYPTNLSNPDANSTDPTLSFVGIEQLAHIRSDVEASMKKSFSSPIINWQDVVDMIVTRYSDRLQYMASGLPQSEFLSIINNLLNIFINYEEEVVIEPLVDTCASYYLKSATPSTEQDHLIYAALKVVTHKICKTLFDVREILFEIEKGDPDSVVSASSALDLILNLNEWLDWSEWKFCGTCGYDKVCFIAMFPYGTTEDHFHPQCRTPDELNNGRFSENYWISRPFLERASVAAR